MDIAIEVIGEENKKTREKPEKKEKNITDNKNEEKNITSNKDKKKQKVIMFMREALLSLLQEIGGNEPQKEKGKEGGEKQIKVKKKKKNSDKKNKCNNKEKNNDEKNEQKNPVTISIKCLLKKLNSKKLYSNSSSAIVTIVNCLHKYEWEYTNKYDHKFSSYVKGFLQLFNEIDISQQMRDEKLQKENKKKREKQIKKVEEEKKKQNTVVNQTSSSEKKKEPFTVVNQTSSFQPNNYQESNFDSNSNSTFFQPRKKNRLQQFLSNLFKSTKESQQ